MTLIKIQCRGIFCKGLPQKWRAWEEYKISCRDEKLKNLSPPWKFAKIFCVKVRFHFFLSSLVHIVPATAAMQRDQPKHAKYSHDHLCYTSHYTKKIIDCKNITAVFYLFFQQQHTAAAKKYAPIKTCGRKKHVYDGSCDMDLKLCPVKKAYFFGIWKELLRRTSVLPHFLNGSVSNFHLTLT